MDETLYRSISIELDNAEARAKFYHAWLHLAQHDHSFTKAQRQVIKGLPNDPEMTIESVLTHFSIAQEDYQAC